MKSHPELSKAFQLRHRQGCTVQRLVENLKVPKSQDDFEHIPFPIHVEKFVNEIDSERVILMNDLANSIDALVAVHKQMKEQRATIRDNPKSWNKVMDQVERQLREMDCI